MTLQLFKWMMALAIMLYLPMLFERVRGIRRQEGKRSDAYVKERVERIYFDVTHFYNRLGTFRQEEEGGGASIPFSVKADKDEWPDFDRLYCTDAWTAQVGAVQQGDERYSSVSDVENEGFFTRNYWTAFADLEFLYANKVEVIDRSGDVATVSLTLHNGDRSVPVLLVMNFEHDDWRIDNMTYYWNEKPSTRYYDWRQEMEKYNYR